MTLSRDPTYPAYSSASQFDINTVSACTPWLTPYRLVLETLTPLPGDRKCFRMINGVLIERTIQDVVPALKTNSDGLGKVLEDLVRQYKGKQEEMERWKVRLRYHGLLECSLLDFWSSAGQD